MQPRRQERVSLTRRHFFGRVRPHAELYRDRLRFAAAIDAGAFDRRRGVAAPDPRLLGRAALDDFADQHPFLLGELQGLGQIGGDAAAADPQVGVLDLAVLLELAPDLALLASADHAAVADPVPLGLDQDAGPGRRAAAFRLAEGAQARRFAVR